VVFIHRFDALLNTHLRFHLYFHCVVVDGVFDGDAEGGVSFRPASGLAAPAIAEVETAVRRRLLRAVERRWLMLADDAQVMAEWEYGGDFSVDAQVATGIDNGHPRGHAFQGPSALPSRDCPRLKRKRY
jgi:Putative transposase.